MNRRDILGIDFIFCAENGNNLETILQRFKWTAPRSELSTNS